MYRAFGKRLLDLLLAVPALLLMLPVMVVIGVVVGIGCGFPVIYYQRRPGLHGRPFTIYKFRTMNDARDASGALLPDAKRLTRVGRLLRSTSLDELPELINIVRGDMSLVGPRPLLMDYLACYTPEQARRHQVRPGLTGIAQVSGRNGLTWEEKFASDVWYVSNLSLLLDLRTLLQTVRAVLRREGISQPGHATAAPFQGAAAEHQASG